MFRVSVLKLATIRMSRIVLIHGFATGVRFSIFRDRKDWDGGFTAFRSLIAWGVASVFRWGIEGDASFWESLNPWFSWKLYERERSIASGFALQQRLANYLEQEQPEVIVCHSLGCYLLWEQLQRFELPSSVKTIVFQQADIGLSELGLFPAREGIQFLNVYCPWDPSLLASWFIWGDRRLGLWRISSRMFEQRFFSLWKPFNLHTSGLRDLRLVSLIQPEQPPLSRGGGFV